MAIVEGFLAAFLTVLLEKMASGEFLKFARYQGIHTLLSNWSNMLSKIQAVLIDAEEKQMPDPAVNLWLDDLHDLAYDLDDVLDEFATEALRQKLMEDPTPQASSSKVWNFIPTFCSNFKPTCVMFNSKMKSKIADITTRLRNSFDQSSQLTLVNVVGTTPTPTPTKTWQKPESTSLFDVPRVYGREHDQSKIIELLVRKDEFSDINVGVIAIVGMVGIGKTTVARMVYNHETVDKHFDQKAWVCVSDGFDIMRITKAILQSVTSHTCSFHDLTQGQVQLKHALAGRRFLIVLDDVWNKNYIDWYILASPFNSGAQGSKVLVTTCNRDVARMMPTVELHDIEVLSDEDCWPLFAQHAFENTSIDANPNLELIGKRIVEKCKGLPLAATTLGGLLRCKVRDEEWVDVLHSKIWDLSHEESYHHLQRVVEIEEITTILHNRSQQRSELNSEKIVGTTAVQICQRPASTSLLHVPCIYGREKDQRKILELLLGRDEYSQNNVGVIPIVGMGGIGKTTLAQMVYKHETVNEHFDRKAWVCVSDDFDIMRITKAILESVTSQTCSFYGLDQAQVQLQKALAGRRFLIVLDDVWNKKYSDWNILKSPFNNGAQGSKVLVTTCNRAVARMMATVELHDMEVLSDEDCWSLFAQHAFENTSIDANPNLELIGKNIVEKCNGLPLAAMTLGGLLRCKVRDEEWVDVLHSKIWDLSHDESYHHLQRVVEIEEITTILHNRSQQRSELNSEKIVGTTAVQIWQRPASTSLLHVPCIYGREKDQRKILELLLGRDEYSQNNVGVIPIVGMGGIGKTTLAQMVYKHETVNEHFDQKAWVCVSDDFDIMRITKAILESVTSQTCSFYGLDQAQVQLQKALAGRRFLIVLDDVWNKKYSDWNILKSPFNSGAQGSKVVVTTRNRDVARMMATVELHDIEVLSDEDCWSLFARHAFEITSIDANPNLESIGKKIVEKCKGLPLAATTLGGLLRCKVRDEEWVDVLHSNIWDLSHEESCHHLQRVVEIEEITTILHNRSQQRSELSSEKIVGTTAVKIWQRPASTSLLHVPGIYGREKDQRKIIELLLGRDESSQNNVGVIPIVGMGGIGKTTLAQMVYNHEIVNKHFDLKAWVCVSNDFDIMRITKAILMSVTSQTCSFYGLDQSQVQLQKALAGRRFLIVLDDVWNKKYSDWNILKSLFNSGAHGSKVVVTTRNRDVAAVMGTFQLHDIEILSNEDCWSLFAQHAFGNRSIGANPNLVSIGKNIVEKCGGLPLAVSSLGSLLRCKERDEEWLDVLRCKIWDLPHSESEILPALRLSYHHLPPHLKLCFSYCSMIPKGYEFEEEELVLLWMAEGFIQQQKVKQMEDVGREYFRELLSRCFFKPSRTGKSSKFVMHDLLNDLAQSVARDYYFRLEDKLNDQKLCINVHRAQYLSYVQGYCAGLKKFESFHKVKRLRTFLPFSLKETSRYSTRNVAFDLLPKLPCLRALSLSRYRINQVPDSIGDLKHLRFLNLSYTPIIRLPKSLGTLFNLQTLMLRGCGYLKKFPKNMGNLINLRHLDITDADSLEEMPLGIGKLTSLRTLSNFIVNIGSQISELGNLIHLGGTLSISGLQNLVDPLDARGANLNEKHHLDVLSMEWSKSSDDLRNEIVETEVLDMLQPRKNLKSLHIRYYFGTRFPTWIGDPLFSKMVCLRLENCQNCMSLPPLGQLPSLNELYIEGMSTIKHVGLEFYGQGVSKPFPLLERLSFVNMPEWVGWSTFGVNEEVKPFPHVSELSIQKCPKLLGMLPNDLPCLSSLTINECPQLLVDVSSLIFQSLTFLSMRDAPLPSLQMLLEARNTLEPTSLASLDMKDVSIPDFLCNLSVADEVMLENAMSKHLSSVTSLSIENIEKLAFLPKFVTEGLMGLEKLKIYGCKELRTLWKNDVRPQTCLLALQHLVIKSCPQLVSLFEEEKDDENMWQQQKQQHQEIPCIVSLEFLEIYNCEKLEKLPRGLHTVTSLRELRIKRCPSLVSFPETGFPSTLRKLVVDKCKALKSLSGWIMQNGNNNSLEVLQVTGCPSLTYLGGVPTTLNTLRFGGVRSWSNYW